MIVSLIVIVFMWKPASVSTVSSAAVIHDLK